MIITVTERGQFRRCRRMWDYTSFNRQRLEPIINQPALMTGSIVHLTMAAWAKDENLDPKELFLGFGNDAMDAMRDTYLKKVGAAVSESELQPLYDGLYLGMNMVENYRIHYGSAIPQGYRMVEPEQTCVVEIPGTEHFLEGTLDALLEDEKGWYWVLERKTYGNRPRLEVLQMNDQFLAYDWMLTQLFPEKRIGGVLYDGMWKRDNKPLDECFMRHEFIHPSEQLADFQRNLVNEVLDMAGEPAIYPNRQWMGCFDCKAFDRLCTAQSRGEDWEYMRDTYFKVRDNKLVEVAYDNE